MEASFLTPDSASTQALLDAVSRGAVVLTPTRRVARQLAVAADAAALSRGDLSWRAPAILPWSAWAAAQWSTAIVHGTTTQVLLNETQEHALWVGVILESGTDTPHTAASHADLCMRAFRLLATFRADTAVAGGWSAETLTADMETFRRWHRRFAEVCQRENYLPAARVDAELSTLFLQRQVVPDTEYLVYGFTELTPARRDVVTALRQAGAAVTELQRSPVATSQPLLLQQPSREAELRACAHWARSRLEEAPEQTVTIVAPDLQDIRSDLERELRRWVSPASANVLNPAPVPYEFSSGLPSQSLPLVRTALLLLRWCADRLPLDDAGALLRSPHLTLAGSPEQGALLDESLLRTRSAPRKHVSLHAASLLMRAHPAGRHLLELDREAERLRSVKKQTFAYFADRVPALLQAAGWPGDGPLNGDERQAADHWQGILDEVASLDLLGKSTRWQAFVAEVSARVANAVFVLDPGGLPVQVISVGEAEGSFADALWFLHAEAEAWPQRGGPNPLLPLALQREFGMPGVTQERDESLAAAQLRHLLGSACGEVRLTWSPDASGTGNPSPLVEQVVLGLGGESAVAPGPPSADAVEPRLETFFDTARLPSLPQGQVFGGVSVLTAQAQCGFRAWAEKRLFAAPLEAVEDGLSPRERGDLVHEVLEAFWRKAGTQAELLRMSRNLETDGPSERDRLLLACIEEKCRTSSPESWDTAYLAVQQQRLFRLLSAWLDYEQQRPRFRVTQLEKAVQDVPVGPLQLRMRVDRVDRVDTVLADGSDSEQTLGTVLIDYKTGSSSRSDWEGDRPNQPQLPAYAVAAASAAGVERVDGIAFASIRAGTDNLHLDGFAQPGLLPPRKRSDKQSFAEHTAEWHTSVEALAEAFANGDAAVDPKLYPQTCKTCAQRILCRLNVATLLQTDPDQLEEYPMEVE